MSHVDPTREQFKAIFGLPQHIDGWALSATAAVQCHAAR
jgi:hypothetical protein